MIDKLKGIEERYGEIEKKLIDPAIIANIREYTRLAKERAQLADLVACAREYRKVLDDLAEHKAVLDGADPELRELARAELPAMQKRAAALEDKLRQLLTPRDPNDERNVLLEIRAGTGGAEASLFAGELYRMYSRYAEHHGWKIEPLSLS